LEFGLKNDTARSSQQTEPLGTIIDSLESFKV
jgi:hypothetical protein